jgi:hypothetical protein
VDTGELSIVFHMGNVLLRFHSAKSHALTRTESCLLKRGHQANSKRYTGNPYPIVCEECPTAGKPKHQVFGEPFSHCNQNKSLLGCSSAQLEIVVHLAIHTWGESSSGHSNFACRDSCDLCAVHLVAIDVKVEG